MKTAIFWMSPGNSYFKKERIKHALNALLDEYDTILVISPAALALHTYRAMGYDETKAARKARQNTNRLLNHARRIKESLTTTQQERIKIVDWQADISDEPIYQRAHEYIKQLYDNNTTFQNACTNMTANVLASKTNSQPDDPQIKEGVKYLLKELAFVWASTDITGANKCDYIYHRDFEILRKLLEGAYTGFKHENVQLRIQEYE